MRFAPNKPKRIWPVIVGAVLLTAVLVVLCIIGFKKQSLARALKNLDVEQEASVIRVMKYGSKNKDALLEIANKYLEAEMYTDCARLCMYAVQYQGCDDALPILKTALEKQGADILYISQFDSEITVSDFEVITENGTDGYGIADGIYTEFLGGYAKAKISSAIPIDIYASKSGAVFLDTSDRFVKSISRDGSKINPETLYRVSEFVYKDSQIYCIDENGQLVGSEKITLGEGETAKNLRIEGEKVMCTVYDKNGESLREMTLVY